ncbi:MAG: glycosyltransferase [Patescibacteria group bacterium]|jgi:glycosyltransferase involved in cell wall biosynthesis
MRIAIVTNFKKPIPSPKDSIYAPGLIIGAIADGLVERGHRVTLFAGSDSRTVAQLESLGHSSAYAEFGGLGRDPQGELQLELAALGNAVARANGGEFDIIQVHDYRHTLHFAQLSQVPFVATNPGNPEDLQPDYRARYLKDGAQSAWTVTMTEWQRQHFAPYIRHLATIPHGINLADFPYVAHPEVGLLYIGRMIERKGPDTAAAVAKVLGVSLDMYGAPGLSEADRQFWDKTQAKFVDGERVRFRGYVPHGDVGSLYGRYRALLLPLRESESFGLVMVEAMAAGTPVVVYDVGSVREIVEDGVTGFVVPAGDFDAFTAAVRKVDSIDRAACRAHVERRFTTARMVNAYEDAFARLV